MDPIFFDSREEFRDWLEEHHDTADETWVGYYKADADRSGIGYGESVEEAISGTDVERREQVAPFVRRCSPTVVSESLVAAATLGEHRDGVVSEDPSPSVATTTVT